VLIVRLQQRVDQLVLFLLGQAIVVGDDLAERVDGGRGRAMHRAVQVVVNLGNALELDLRTSHRGERWGGVGGGELYLDEALLVDELEAVSSGVVDTPAELDVEDALAVCERCSHCVCVCACVCVHVYVC